MLAPQEKYQDILCMVAFSSFKQQQKSDRWIDHPLTTFLNTFKSFINKHFSIFEKKLNQWMEFLPKTHHQSEIE